jgi:hypothetical protein
MKRSRLYAGTFLLALSTLALEISLARLLSVVSWYYLAFFTISTAMLGSTAGAMFVFLRPAPSSDGEVTRRLVRSTLGYAASLPVVLVLLCVIPMDFQLSRLTIMMNLATMMLATAASCTPYFFAGIVITSVLTREDLPVGKIYASDLIGASFGCLLVLAALSWYSVPTLVLLCALIALVAAVLYAGAAWRSVWRSATVLCALVVALIALTEGRPFGLLGIRPVAIKGHFILEDLPIFERWNSFSRVTVNGMYHYVPFYWGRSPRAPVTDTVDQHMMSIDGAAGTSITRFHSMDDIRFLRYDVTNLAYALRPTGGACIVGVGGGRDIMSALLFGHERVLGVELNPIFLDLHAGLFRRFSGIYDNPRVSLIADEGRSYLTRTTEHFAVIQLSLIDTWASTGAGAFSLSENSLYTTEAFGVFLHRLKDDGILTISRWHNKDDLGETGRLLSLAKASLLQEGVKQPERHICFISCDQISAMLLKRTPFTQAEIGTLSRLCDSLAFTKAVIPGDTVRHYWLNRIMKAGSVEELSTMGRSEPIDFSPATDERPFFFNMLRFSHIPEAISDRSILHTRGVIRGNLIAVIVLAMLIISLTVAAVVAILLPLLAARRTLRRPPGTTGIFIAGAVYFSLIGAGFMLLEISLMQRFTMLLGHPIYSLGIILFSIILSTGGGSFLSERIRVDGARRLWLLPVTLIVVIVLLLLLLPSLIGAFISSPIGLRAVVACIVLVPLGLLLGCFFPVGMRLVRATALPASVTPWYWGLNGMFGVLSSAAAVMISMYSGISTNQMLAACFYLLLIPCMAVLAGRRAASERSSGAGR